MRKIFYIGVALLVGACEGLTGPMGELPLAVTVDDRDNTWTLVHAIAPHDRGPTRQYYRLVHTVPEEFQTVIGTPLLAEVTVPASPLWEADAWPPLGGPLAQTALLAPGDPPAAWIAGRYPGAQVTLTRIAPDGAATRWRLPDQWPEAYALDVTSNAVRTWVRPEQWWPQRPDDFAPLIEIRGTQAKVKAHNAVWMGCNARGCAYATLADGRLTLRSAAEKTLASKAAHEAGFTAACQAGGRTYVVTDHEYFAVAITGISAPVTHTSDVQAILADAAGTLECRRAPWLWISARSGALYSFDVTATAVRELALGVGKDAWVRYARGASGWAAAQALPVGEQTMWCDPAGSWTYSCTATYENYELKLSNLRGN